MKHEALDRGASPLGGDAQRGEQPAQPRLFGAPQTQYSTDDYYTPKWIFDAMDIEFDLDVACPPHGSVNVPAESFYTQTDDGLAQPWYGRVWMNPPYSQPAPWVARWLEHGNGMALLPTNGGKWARLLWESDARGIWLGRLAFIRDGVERKGSTMNIVLWAIGEQNVEAASRLGRPR